MHAEAFYFVAHAASLLPPGGEVLEFGSLNVNGSVRPLFAGWRRYHGIDLAPGRDVDEVADAKTYDGGEAYDVVVTCEALEHEAEPGQILAAAWRALRPGGYLIVTCASLLRAPHGCDGGALPAHESYTRIAPSALDGWLTAQGWRTYILTHNTQHGDLYALAQRPPL